MSGERVLLIGDEQLEANNMAIGAAFEGKAERLMRQMIAEGWTAREIASFGKFLANPNHWNVKLTLDGSAGATE